jgi:hypothetical protein
MTTVTEALDHYHKCYNNATYQAAQIALVRDLCGVDQTHTHATLEVALRSEPVHHLANLLINVCLEISGHPMHQGQHTLLMRALVAAQVSSETVHLISQHIKKFEVTGGTFAANLESGVLVLLHLRDINVNSAAEEANKLHSSAGSATREVLYAVNTLLRLANMLLKGEGDEAYRQEKLTEAERYLAYAKNDLTK